MCWVNLAEEISPMSGSRRISSRSAPPTWTPDSLLRAYHRNQQWVSIKIGTRTLLKHPVHERDIMRKFDDGDSSHPGYSRIIHLLDFFVHEGTNGQHVCLVYKAMGESLGHFQAKFRHQKLSLFLMKRVTSQLLEALDYIHQRSIIHTGKAAT